MFVHEFRKHNSCVFIHCLLQRCLWHQHILLNLINSTGAQRRFSPSTTTTTVTAVPTHKWGVCSTLSCLFSAFVHVSITVVRLSNEKHFKSISEQNKPLQKRDVKNVFLNSLEARWNLCNEVNYLLSQILFCLSLFVWETSNWNKRVCCLYLIQTHVFWGRSAPVGPANQKHEDKPVRSSSCPAVVSSASRDQTTIQMNHLKFEMHTEVRLAL